MSNKIISCIAAVTLFSGCASQTNWTPTIDAYNDPNAQRIGADLAECKQIALQASGGTARETTIGALVGGAIGAASGAAISAATGGSAASGAITGAAAGGIGGGLYQGYNAEDGYKRAYSNCLRSRGHRVLN